MESHDESTRDAVGAISVQLCSPYLATRLQAVQDATSLFENAAVSDIKAGPLKRVLKELILCLTGGPALIIANRKEKAWPQAIHAFILKMSNDQIESRLDLPFHFVSFCAEVLSEKEDTTDSTEVEVLQQMSELALFLLSCAHSSKNEVDMTGCVELMKVLNKTLNKLSSLQGVNQACSRSKSKSEDAFKCVQSSAFRTLAKIPVMLPFFLTFWTGHLLKTQLDEVYGSPQICLPGFGILYYIYVKSPTSPVAQAIEEHIDIQPTRLNVLNNVLSGGVSSPSTFKYAISAASVIGSLRFCCHVLASVTSAEWSEIESQLVKQLKKNPETSAVMVATVCEGASVPFDDLLHDGLGLVIPRLLRSASPEVRSAGLCLVNIIAQRCCDGDSGSSLVLISLSLCEALNGKPITAGGRLTASGGGAGGGFQLTVESQKKTIIEALGLCVTAINNFAGVNKGEGIQIIVDAATDALFNAIDKEKDVGIKYEEADLASKWMLSQTTLTSANLSFIVKGLSVKGSAGPYLLILSSLFVAPVSGNVSEYARILAESQSLLLLLLNCAEMSQKKPQVSSPEGVLALRILLEIHSLVRLPPATHKSVMSILTDALPTGNDISDTSFLMALALHSQLAGRSSSISSTNNSPMGHGVLEAILAIVGIACRDYSNCVPIFISSQCSESDSTPDLESKEDMSCFVFGYGFAVRKLVLFCVISLRDHHLRKRVCTYWLPHILRACIAYNTTHCGDNFDAQYAGTVSLLDEFNYQLRCAAEFREKVRNDELSNFKGKDSGNGAIITSTLDSSTSLFLQTPGQCLSETLFLFFLPPTDGEAVPVKGVLSVRAFSLGLLLSAHPFLSNNSLVRNTQMYQKLVKLYLRLPSSISSLDSTVKQNLQETISGGIFSTQTSVANRRAGGQAALLLYNTNSSLSGDSGRALVIEVILPQLAEELHSDVISQFSEEEICVWQNPLYLMQEIERNVTSGAGIDDLKITNADRKKSSARGSRRGQFGADFNEDDEWAEQLMKEKREKKIKGAQEAAKNSPEMTRALERTSEIKTKVGRILERSKAALGLLSFLASKYSDAFESMTIVLLNPLLELLRSPLLHDQSLDTLNALIGALVQNSTLSKIRLDIGSSLELVATVILKSSSFQADKRQDSVCREVSNRIGPVINTLRVLHFLAVQAASASKHGGKDSNVISTGCFQLIFPILRGVLSLKQQIPGCEHAFMILENLWQCVTRTQESALMCRSLFRHMLEAILCVASRSSRSTAHASEFLLSLLTFTLSPLEWAPLLGESGLLSADVSIRRLAISAALKLARQEQAVGEAEILLSRRMRNQPLVVSRVWLSSYDESEEVREMSREIWEVTKMELPQAFITPLLPILELESTTEELKQSAANALAAGMNVHPDLSSDCLSTLNAIYVAALPQAPPSAVPLAIPKLASENSVGSNRSSGSTDLSIGAVRNSLSGGRNKAAAKKSSAIDMAMIGMGSKKKTPAKKVGGAGVGIGIGIGTKPVQKRNVVEKESKPSVTEQISRIEKEVEDHKWKSRQVVALCYCSIGKSAALTPRNEGCEDVPHVTEMLRMILQFLLTEGVTDPKEEVRSKMVLAGRSLIDTYGLEHCNVIVGLLESTLAQEQPSNKAELVKFDLRHEATVILLGAAAKHLSKDDPNVKSIMESLVTSLSTPVESVQKAVADCLVPLVQARKTEDRVKELIEELMTQVVDGDSYGARRGAAFGLSAFVKGSGIPAIKNHDLVSRLKEYATSGGNNQRQGALFAFELLSDRLGMLFEPYVISIVPLLLKSFSHSSDHVREAAQLGAKTIMGRLSSHGVKQVLTPILQSLPTESQWKSRQEALRLLGSMAFCAPRQLASCLPQVIPRLVEAGSDPHPKVKEGAKSALTDISSVIRNPEVSRLSPILLKALTDPATQTKFALDALLECEFMHSIDAPSLALLIPILGRALKDRGGDLKRKSAVILGNMASMISDSKILSPYLPQVVPGLKEVLLDPIPDVRATSAKALGGLMLGMGEGEMPDLVPWCLSSLSIETSPVERSGAAQGLAEVCLALGSDRVNEILEGALKLQYSSNSASREGLLWFLAFLPAVMEENFADHIGDTLPVVLKGLSDNTEGVREVAMRSGQVFVSCHGRNHSDEVLPPLLAGMFDLDWRIRESSVSLLGELLYLIGEAKAVGLSNREVDGGDIAEGGYLNSLSRVISTIRDHVGDDMADNILSSLYIVRSDNSVSVRQCALQVWKSIVANTPRILRQIMPTLVQQIISMLSSSGENTTAGGDMFEPDFEEDGDLEDEESNTETTAVAGAKGRGGASEQNTVAGRALGELVRKLGDHVLPLIIPYLQNGLSSNVDHLRQGVCLGLSEILKAASAKQITTYIDTLVPALQQAICDSSSHVRTLAAQAFHALARAIGHQAFDSVLPPLLTAVANDYETAQNDDTSACYALLGLEGIASHRPRDLLEYLTPILLTSPLQAWAANALGRLAICSNKNIHHHYSELIPQLIFELGTGSFMVEQLTSAGEPNVREVHRLETVKHCAGAVVGASTTAGINFLVSELGKQIEQAALDAHSSTVVKTSSTTISPITSRRWGCWLLGQFFVHTNVGSENATDYSEYVPLFLKYLLARSADNDLETLNTVVEALKFLVKAVPVEVLVTHIDFIRSCINLTASDAKHRVNKQDKERLYDPVTGQFILPLFRVPKALENILPIFIHALMNGSVDARETAATAIGELASMTETPLLKPYLIKTTGPLIRVVGDRFPSNVKFAILETLSVLLQKGGIGLKAFVPQLQTTFVKSLSDPSKQVRTRASNCLGILVPMSSRVDPLLSELSLGVQGAESSAICVSFAEGICSVLRAAGGKASEEVLEKISRALLATTVSEDEQVRAASAVTLGSLTVLFTSPKQVSNLLLDLLPPGRGGVTLASSGEHWTGIAGRLISCGTVLHHAGELGQDMQLEVLDFFEQAFADDRVAVRVAACGAAATLATMADESMLAVHEQLCGIALERFAPLLVRSAERTGLADDSLEVRRAAFAKNYQPLCVPYAGEIARVLHPYVVPNAEINIRLKKSVERTLKYLLGIRHYQGAKSEACVITATPSSASAALQNISSTNTDIGRFMQQFSNKGWVKKATVWTGDSNSDVSLFAQKLSTIIALLH